MNEPAETPQPPQQAPGQTPEQTRRAVRALLIASPFLFVFSYFFAEIQGAQWQHALLIAFVALAMCLGAALLQHLRGGKAMDDLGWLALVLRLLARR